MSTLKMFHDFVEILKQYIGLPPPKIDLSDYIKEKIRSPENHGKPMTFNINTQRVGIIFYVRIHIRNKGIFNGLVSSFELKENGIVLIIYDSPTNLINLGEIPFSNIITFHEVKYTESKNFMPSPMKTIISNRRPWEDKQCTPPHYRSSWIK